MLRVLDGFVTLLIFAAPVWLVWRLNLPGVLPGALASWLLGVYGGYVLSAHDPHRGRVLDGVWLYFGWAFCLLYALLVYGLKRLSAALIRGRRSP